MFLLLVFMVGVVSTQNANLETPQKEDTEMAQNAGVTFRMQMTEERRIPKDVMRDLPNNVDTLQLAHNKIERITKEDFPEGCCLQIIFINLHDNYITYIEEGVFEHLPNLVRIDLSDNILKTVPNMKARKVQRIDLQINFIKSIEKSAMDHYKLLWHLDLRSNEVKEIEANTFEENKELIYMDLSKNPLESIDEVGLPAGIEYLLLDHTSLNRLPSEQGIKNLKKLSIRNTPHLFTIPDPSLFERLQKIDVTYSMHCCAFMEKQRGEPVYANNENVTEDCNGTVVDAGLMISPQFGNETENSNETESDDSMFGSSFVNNNFMDDFLESVFGPEDFDQNTTNVSLCDGSGEMFYRPRNIKCSPEPDAFNPCQDVMGSTALRGFSWIISIIAVLGNLFQLIILFYSRQELTVYKLLMYNLGFANLMMGMYLLVLCCVDSYTYGKYYNYVQMWQYSGGCQAFGFIAMFATQLSFCSLVVITVERFLLIIFALQIGKQMKLRHAKIAVATTWLYSIIVALLPVTGKVSSYSKIAICLPVDIPTKVALGYIVWLLLAYIIAFIIIVALYLKMYISINKSRAGRPGSNRNTIDVQVAKRMAMIIFSNFMCWLPISITGFIALFSDLKLNVDVAKFLLVFIFPLNACTNPFLYAIFTKVFRGDTLALLSSCGLCKNADKNYRNRAPSNYLKSTKPKQRSGTDTKHFMHQEPPSRPSNRVERNIEAQTDFDSPETPIKVMIDPNRSYHHPIRGGESDTKPRSDSTRGLLEDKDLRFRSESSDTCSTGMSVQSTDSEVYDEFSKMIGSVKSENYLA